MKDKLKLLLAHLACASEDVVFILKLQAVLLNVNRLWQLLSHNLLPGRVLMEV